MIYDIIGDVHGQADMLEDLLLKLEYRYQQGIYRHSQRTPVFVGDLIDGGEQNRRVIEVVRPMVESGCALAVLGNHEYNAVCYHTPRPGSKTDWLRPHTASKFRQHEKFLREYPLGHSDTREVIDWFTSLPLFLEINGFRVVHACWDQKMIELAGKKYLNQDNTLDMEHVIKALAAGSTEFDDMIERLLKGVEVKLPPLCSFQDKYGKTRHHIRVKWWGKPGLSYRKLALGYDEIQDKFPADQAPEQNAIPRYGREEPPVFFGHYWQTGEPQLKADNICCVDYSAGRKNKLACYSLDWDRKGSPLGGDRFTWVRP
jgi:hypothetical protein